MIQIHRMTATFGRLDGETLTLTPGLNIFTAPNEAGKSTWAAFLVAMFYGIDTAERAKKGTLPAKTKYKPWSGKPMEGVVELTWNGRDITLQRQAEGRTPMGKLTAYDTQTGEPLAFLTAENCGRTLLGVEQSVFVRSAFVGQSAMSVSQDPGLEQRLSSLVTAGDETVSYTQTERRLRDWKNHVRHNRTGYLPEAENRRAAVEDKLQTIRQYHREDLDLHVRQQTLMARKEKLQYIEKNLTAAEAYRKQQQLRAAEEKLQQATEKLQSAKALTDALPELQTLQDLRRDMDALALRQELAAKSPQPVLPREPEIPAVFCGVTPEQAREKAAADTQTLRELAQPVKTAPVWLAAVLLAALAVAGFFLLRPAAYVLLGLSVVALIIHVALASSRKKQQKQQQTQMDALLQQYGVSAGHEILLMAARYEENCRQHADALAAYRTQTETQQMEMAELEMLQQKILAAVREFASNIYTMEDAKNAVASAMDTHRQVEMAQTAFSAAGSSCDAIRAAVGDAACVQAPEEDLTGTYSLPQITRELSQTEQELRSVETTLAQHGGNVQALGDPAALEAEKQQLDGQLSALSTRETALALAMDALGEANSTLRSRFSPQISKAAGEILDRMTGGRYDALRMEQDLTLYAKQTDEAVPRELLQLSSGTADQLYLALRLAICDLALEEGTPLVLDDALVFFDDDRLAQTMELLKEESEKRQILLFSCQNREAEYTAKENVL